MRSTTQYQLVVISPSSTCSTVRIHKIPYASYRIRLKTQRHRTNSPTPGSASGSGQGIPHTSCWQQLPSAGIASPPNSSFRVSSAIHCCSAATTTTCGSWSRKRTAQLPTRRTMLLREADNMGGDNQMNTLRIDDTNAFTPTNSKPQLASAAMTAAGDGGGLPLLCPKSCSTADSCSLVLKFRRLPSRFWGKCQSVGPARPLLK